MPPCWVNTPAEPRRSCVSDVSVSTFVRVTDQEFFDRLEPAQREIIADRSVTRRYRRGQKLFLEGDSASEFLIILTGQVKITVASHDGREVLLEVRGKGEVIGEMALIDQAPRSASAFSLVTPTECLVMSVRSFRELVDTDPAFTRVLLTEMVHKVRGASFHQLELALDDVNGRVVRRLLELDRRFGTGVEGAPIKSPITQQELADWAGVSRQAVVKELRLLRDDGVLATKGSTITIHNREALVDRASRLAGLA